MDPRVSKTQQLFWETSALKKKGEFSAARPNFAEMATLHQERGEELLRGGNPDGWIDFYAAVTAWGEAGESTRAKDLIRQGELLAASFPEGKENIRTELAHLDTWLASLPIPLNGESNPMSSPQRGEGVA